MEQNELKHIGQAFGKDAKFRPIGAGHINDTYRSEDGRWILQRINTEIFKKPEEVMENIEAVTACLRKKLAEDGKDPSRGTLTVVPAEDGALLVRTESGVFRMYENIRDAHSVEPEERTLQEFEKAAAAFGRFQRALQAFPAKKLHETIPDFHHTVKRLARLKEVFSERLRDEKKAAAEQETAGSLSPEPEREARIQRLHQALPWIEYALSVEKIAPMVLDGLANGSIPLAVTHNDTKINNVLFDDDTNEAIAVIDLDTVMPGSRLYDFGDAVRSGAVTAAEDEPELSKVHFDPEAYLAFKRGYLSEMADALTAREKELLLPSAELMTYECGIRFLTDYLEGDPYFKTDYPEHNLVRARNQFRILQEMLKLPEDL